MPIRNSLAKEAKESGFVNRMLAAAIKAQKTNIKEVEAFGDSEDTMRREHEFLAWLERHQRMDGELQLVPK